MQIDQDHKDAAGAILGTSAGVTGAAAAHRYNLPDLADLVNIVTIIFVVMQAGLLIPKYVNWVKRVWEERKK